MHTTRDLLQQAWVVDDIEAAARRWSRLLGIGPFFMKDFEPEFFSDVVYRGGPGRLQMRTAICYAGAVQIELIQPVGPVPNVYRDTVPAGTEGFHHVCFWTDSMDADIARYEAQGAPLAVRGRSPTGSQFAYVDTSRTLGCMVELLEHTPRLEAVFEGWRAACAAWRGGDLFVPR